MSNCCPSTAAIYLQSLTTCTVQSFGLADPSETVPINGCTPNMTCGVIIPTAPTNNYAVCCP